MKTANNILVSKVCQKLWQNEIVIDANVNKIQAMVSGHFLLYLSAKCPQTRPHMPLVKVIAVPVTIPNFA